MLGWRGSTTSDRSPPLRGCETTTGRSKQMKALVAAMISSMIGTCAPDSVRNHEAIGFNGYLNFLKTACPDLQIGANDIGLEGIEKRVDGISLRQQHFLLWRKRAARYGWLHQCPAMRL